MRSEGLMNALKIDRLGRCEAGNFDPQLMIGQRSNKFPQFERLFETFSDAANGANVPRGTFLKGPWWTLHRVAREGMQFCSTWNIFGRRAPKPQAA